VKARIRLAGVEERMPNRRRDFAYKTARGIVNRYEEIYEDLRIGNMVRNRKLSKSVGDASWGMLRSALTYMAERSEGRIALVDPRNTSQLCSGCEAIVEKPLSERTRRCLVCGLVLDRDANASRNVLRIGLGQPESTPEGDVASTPPLGAVQAVLIN